MITPTYASTATERVLPRMALNFTTAVTDSRVATVRAGNTATRTNSGGVIEIVNANLPRYDFSPTTLVCLGQLIEESRTNLFLNSLINGTSLSTQTVVVTNVAHTISFYGTGTITLSGAATATVTGTGAYPNRQTLTFTPIVGGLICTVTGSVQYAQLEVGAFATSFIPTTVASVTRNADVVSMTGTNFSDWYNASEGAILGRFSSQSTSSTGVEIRATAGNTDFIRLSRNSSTAYVRIFSGSVEQVSIFPAITGSSWSTGVSVLAAYKVNSFATSASGTATGTDNLGAVPVSPTNMNIGTSAAGGYINGHMQRISYWPQRIINAEVQAFSK